MGKCRLLLSERVVGEGQCASRSMAERAIPCLAVGALSEIPTESGGDMPGRPEGGG